MITSFVNIASENNTGIKRLIWKSLLKSILVPVYCLLVYNSSFGQVTGDFRSNGNVTFSAAVNWERYNGSAWIGAGAAPVQSDNVITIRTGNTATVSSNKTIDQVFVESGGVLCINSGQTLTIANGTGTDLNVSGTINNSGIITPTGTIIFNSSSSYNHNQDGGTIPTATWNSSSNCNITGVTVTEPNGLSQFFGNFIWNCTGQTGSELNINPLSVSFSGAVTGNFTVASTGTGSIRLSNVTPRILDISGNFNISGGLFILAINTGSAIVNIGGDFNMTGGTLTETGSSSGLFVFDNGGTTQNFRRTTGVISNNIGFTVNSNVTIDFGSSDYANGSGTFTLNNGATLQTSNPLGLGSNGSIQTATRSLSASANYTFDGTVAQATGAYLPAIVNNIRISNISGITLTNTVNAAGTLTLNSGNINTGAGTLILSNPLSSSLIYTTGIIVGRFERYINTTSINYFFPVGTTSQIQLLTINFVNLTAGSLLVQYISGDPGNSGLPLSDGDGSQVTNQFTTGYWSALAKNSLSSTNYNLDLNATGFGPYTINAGTRLIKRTDTGGSWLSSGNHSGAVGSVVKRTGMSGVFNGGGGTQFGLGKSGPKILTQPSNQTVSEAVSGTFSIAATGYTLSYQWFKAPGTSLTNDGHYGGVTTSTLNITNIVSGDAGNYYCIVTDGNGNTVQSTSASLTVNVLLPVSVTIAASANPVCTGTSVTFTASPVNGGLTPAYQWYKGAAPVGTGLATYTYTPVNGDVITVVLTSSETFKSGSPATSNTISMTVNPSLPLSVTIAASANPVCAGTSVTFTASPVNGGITPAYQWYKGASQVGEGLAAYTYTPVNGDVISVVLTSNMSCTSGSPSTSNNITTTVNALPVATFDYSGTPLCQDAANPIPAFSGGGVPGTFSSDAGLVFISTATGQINLAGSLPGSYTVTNTIPVTGGCSIVTATSNLTINPKPTVSVTNPPAVCFPSTVDLTVASTTAESTTGLTFTYWTDAAATLSFVTPETTGTGTYYIKGTNGATGCYDIKPISVSVNPSPVATASNSSPVCAGSILNLTGGPAGMTTYSWAGPGGFSSSQQSPLVSSNATLAKAGVYTLLITNASGCSNTTSTTIVVNAVPLVNITSSNSNMCITDLRTLSGIPAGGTFIVSSGPGSITGNVLKATGSGNINLEYNITDVCSNKATQSIIVNEIPVANTGDDIKLTYIFETQMKAEILSMEVGEWSLVSGRGNIVDIHSPTTSITDLSFGENIFLWKVLNGACMASKEAKITVEDLFIPSVITPNGDGKNDYFKVSENIGKIEIIIFNRWGIEEYSNRNYLNDWDGRNNKGSQLPDDTYFFILKLKDGKVKKGSILIKR